jgi:hypothetical protein
MEVESINPLLNSQKRNSSEFKVASTYYPKEQHSPSSSPIIGGHMHIVTPDTNPSNSQQRTFLSKEETSEEDETFLKDRASPTLSVLEIQESPFISLESTYPVREEDEEDIDFYLPHKLGYLTTTTHPTTASASTQHAAETSSFSSSRETASTNVSYSDIYPGLSSPAIASQSNLSPWRMHISENSPILNNYNIANYTNNMTIQGEESEVGTGENDPSEELWKVVDGEIDEVYSNDGYGGGGGDQAVAAQEDSSEAIPSTIPKRRRSFSSKSPSPSTIQGEDDVSRHTHGHAHLSTATLRHQLLEKKGYALMAEHAVEKVIQELIDNCSQLILFDLNLLSERTLQHCQVRGIGTDSDEKIPWSNQVRIYCVHFLTNLAHGIANLITWSLWICVRVYLWLMFVPLRLIENGLYFTFQVIIGCTVMLLSLFSVVNEDIKNQPLPNALKSQVLMTPNE